MSNHALTTVRGIGPATATLLADAGFGSIEALAAADAAAVAAVRGFGPSRAHAVIADALRLAGITAEPEPVEHVAEIEEPKAPKPKKSKAERAKKRKAQRKELKKARRELLSQLEEATRKWAKAKAQKKSKKRRTKLKKKVKVLEKALARTERKLEELS